MKLETKRSLKMRSKINWPTNTKPISQENFNRLTILIIIVLAFLAGYYQAKSQTLERKIEHLEFLME